MRLIYRQPEKRERLEARLAAVLPTNRFARAYSGVTARAMLKVSTVGRSSEDALRGIAPVIREFARCEGLPARQAAADVRLRREGLRP
jgi:Histidinol dehydrogenase